MYKLELTETCLRDGFNRRLDDTFETLTDLERALHVYCMDRGIDPDKIKSRYRSVQRGTASGVKVFFNPQPGIRIYVWINIYEEKRLV